MMTTTSIAITTPPHPVFAPLGLTQRHDLKQQIAHELKARNAVLVAHYYVACLIR
jgi:quinolinate synthase